MQVVKDLMLHNMIKLDKFKGGGGYIRGLKYQGIF